MGGAPKDVVVVDRLMDVLSEKGLNVKRLAERAGMNYSTAYYIANKGSGRASKVARIASALSVPVEELSEHGMRMREARKEASTMPAVRVGEPYSYPVSQPQSIASVEEPAGEIVEEDDRTTVVVDDVTKIHRTFRVEASDAVLDRVDRVLDIIEALITTPEK